jgi:hypothetical protein
MTIINRPKQRKPWARPEFFIIDHNPVTSGNHNQYNESTVFNTHTQIRSAVTTFYFETQNGGIKTLIGPTRPTQYFS